MIKEKKCPHFDLIKLRLICCDSIKDAYFQKDAYFRCIYESKKMSTSFTQKSVNSTKSYRSGDFFLRGSAKYQQAKCIKIHVVDVFVG